MTTTPRIPARRAHRPSGGLTRHLLLPAVLAAGMCASQESRGASWDFSEERLSRPEVISLTSASGQSAAYLPDGRLYVVWFEGSGAKSSMIRGLEQRAAGTWDGEPTRISLGDSLATNPSLAVGTAGDLHVAWEDGRHGNLEIYYRHRDGNGLWEPEQRLTVDVTPSESPVLGISPTGRLHLVWSEGSPGNPEIFHCWMDSGGAWSPALRLTNHPGASRTPALAMDPTGDLHLVWKDNLIDAVPGENEETTAIYYLKLAADGTPLGIPFRLHYNGWFSWQPTISRGEDGALHIFWWEDTGSASGIWYRRWLPGPGFGRAKEFYSTGSSNHSPRVAAAPDGTVNLVWEDYSYGNSEVSYRQIRPDTGWDVEATRLTVTTGPAQQPCILAGEGGRLDVVWSDATGGEFPSIRHLSGRTDNTTPVLLRDVSLTRDGDRLVLRWETSSEVDHAGFAVYAAQDADGEARRLNGDLITGGPRYELVVAPAALGDARCLKLVAVSRTGHVDVMAVLWVADAVPALPVADRLGPVHPNPCAGMLVIPVACEEAGDARLDLVDARGRLAGRLEIGRLPAGRSEITWNPRSLEGAPLAAGRYWLRLLRNGKPEARPAPVILIH